MITRGEELVRRVDEEGAAVGSQASDIDAALERLVGEGPQAMGALFKVLAITAPGLAIPPGFA